MNANQNPELKEGYILFCHATENSFMAIGPELRSKLERGSFLPEDFRPGRGAKREDYFPLYAKISDLDAETLARLGYVAPATPKPRKVIPSFYVHSSTLGYLDMSDRQQRTLLD